jgi:hypothetical protein
MIDLKARGYEIVRAARIIIAIMIIAGAKLISFLFIVVV